MSLAGKTIVVTRDANQAKSFINKLENLGVQIVLFPTIKITDTKNIDKIHKVLKEINNYDWIAFTSINTVKYFFKYAEKNHKIFETIKIAAVGKKTAEALSIYGLKPSIIPMNYSARGLIEAMSDFEIKGKRILLPGSNIARIELLKGLDARGAIVTKIEIYKNIPNENVPKSELIRKIKNSEIDCITFFSPSAVNSFVEIVGEKVIEIVRSAQIPIAVIGPSTEQAIRLRKMIPVIQPSKSDMDMFIEAIQNHFSD